MDLGYPLNTYGFLPSGHPKSPKADYSHNQTDDNYEAPAAIVHLPGILFTYNLDRISCQLMRS